MDAYDTIKWLEQEYNRLSKRRDSMTEEEWDNSFSKERLNAIVSCIKHLKDYTSLTIEDNRSKRRIIGDDKNS